MRRQVGIVSLERLRPASSVEDRKTFAEAFGLALQTIGVDPGEPFLLAHPSVVDQRVPKAGRCSLCDGPVNENTDYQRIGGWSRRRTEGGANQITLREAVPDEWACAGCIEREKRGIAPAQQSLG